MFSVIFNMRNPSSSSGFLYCKKTLEIISYAFYTYFIVQLRIIWNLLSLFDDALLVPRTDRLSE